MAKHDEYRINAMDAVRLAPRREHWCQEDPLARAERWLDLDTEDMRARPASTSE
jgi:hypothetical protein